MEIRLDGKVALITGASTGLGKAMTWKFAEAGASVMMVARRKEVLEQSQKEIQSAIQGSRISFVSGDVTLPEDCQRVYKEAAQIFGSVDILVNNAGSSARGRFLELTDEDFQSDLDLKLFAAIRLSRLALPEMIQRKWGRILNVLAYIAKAPPAESAPTSVSRAAGLAMTKIVASEAAPHGILVNALLPGLIESDQWVRRHKTLTEDSTYQSFLEKMGKGIPLGRMGEAEEFANMALFLASEQASYITGTGINIDGGLSPVW